MMISKTRWQIRCVIYDCDGVLLDSREANRFFYNAVCMAAGRSPISNDELDYAHTHTVHEAIGFLFRNHPHLEGQARRSLSAIDPQGPLERMTLEPGLVKTLETLKHKGIGRAVSTNRSASMKSIMDRFGLWPFFDLVVTTLDVQNPKPHPESLQRILRTLQVEEEEAVFVGDSEIDRQAAQAAGVKFVAYKNPDLKASAFIPNHPALLDILDP